MKDFTSKNLTVSRIIVNKQKDTDVMIIGQEIKHLKTQLIKPQDDDDWNGSVLQVLFKNEAFARKYRLRVEKFLKDLLEEGEEFIVYHPPQSNSEQEYEGSTQTFHIDRLKSSSLEKEELQKKIPVYSTKYEDTLEKTNSIEDEPEKQNEEKPSIVTCFNCFGDHHMKQCPDKLDYNRINMNKKEILIGSTIRYHSDDQKSSFAPGHLSNELRDALGLRANQLPLFIYHMRVIGYPPGWMDEAVLEKSGLSLYDQDGKATGDNPLPSVKETLYDGNKFITFPGFNTPVPNGVLDEWQTWKMPPLQEHQQLTQALKSPNIILSNSICKRKQGTSGIEDAKKHKKVEKNSSSPCPNESPKSTSARTQQNLNIGLKTPDSKQGNKQHSLSLSVSPGTPILKQGNPFDRLPDADKFAEGITEHLPYENLPDAVGSYEKMRDVISNIQKKLDIINS